MIKMLAQYVYSPRSTFSTLVFEDTFSGSSLDGNSWTAIDNGNLSAEAYYRPGNVTVSGSNMVITTQEEAYGGKSYTSGYVHTFGKKSWTYGRFEVRAKLPKSKGYWPALWMLPIQDEFHETWPPLGGYYGGWPVSGEIDIIEHLGHEPAQIWPGIHVGNPADSDPAPVYTLPSGDFSDGFYVFALEWDVNSFRWFVNDTCIRTRIKSWFSSGGAYPAPYDKPFYLILCTQLGGTWPGATDETTIFPQQFLVDYVRVYQ